MKKFVPVYEGELRKHSIQVPRCISECSGIRIFGRRIKSLVFSTEAIIEHGIARVVVGMEDPNPLVAGKGIALLREAGIEVVCGVEEEALREQNRVFLKYISTKLPWVAYLLLGGEIPFNH